MGRRGLEAIEDHIVEEKLDMMYDAETTRRPSWVSMTGHMDIEKLCACSPDQLSDAFSRGKGELLAIPVCSPLWILCTPCH